MTSVPPLPVDAEVTKSPITRSRFKVRRTNLPLKNNDDVIKNRDVDVKSKNEVFRKDLLVKHRQPISNPSNDVNKNRTEGASDEVLRKKTLPNLEEPSGEATPKKGLIVNNNQEMITPSIDVIQDRIDIVESDELVESTQNLVRLRVVEMEMFKCHRACIDQKTKLNLKDENISQQVMQSYFFRN